MFISNFSCEGGINSSQLINPNLTLLRVVSLLKADSGSGEGMKLEHLPEHVRVRKVSHIQMENVRKDRCPPVDLTMFHLICPVDRRFCYDAEHAHC